jgi:hypothetical protein
MGFGRWRRWNFRTAPPWPLVPVPSPPTQSRNGPLLSVIVIAHEMQHQLANTLTSLTPPYQQAVNPLDYEIQVIDNGSKQPLDARYWSIGSNIRYQHVPPEAAPKNPGVAINRAVAQTRAPLLCIMIDGARLLTPGVLHRATDLATLPRAIVEVRSWHLAEPMQRAPSAGGHGVGSDQHLLQQIDWPAADGYRLFDVAVPTASMPGGFFGTANECTCLFLTRVLFDELGGYDERYTTPGGGLCNADFFVRAVNAAQHVFTLLGEGTFHQMHGGAATGLSEEDRRQKFRRWRDEYETLSRPWHRRAVEYRPILVGHVPTSCRRWLTIEPDGQRQRH